jgi:hypothetical protein
MLIVAIALASVALAQQPESRPPDITLLKANLGGDCSADFTVTDADGKPVYAATVHVRVRYGLLNIKRADLEIGTNSDGKARIEGLPTKARALAYDIEKEGKKANVEQNVSSVCHANFDVSLK